MSDETYLQRLQDYYATHRVLPSFAQIGELLGLKSSSSVAALAKRIKERGYLESGPTGRLAPAKRFFEREVVDIGRATLCRALKPGSNLALLAEMPNVGFDADFDMRVASAPEGISQDALKALIEEGRD